MEKLRAVVFAILVALLFPPACHRTEKEAETERQELVVFAAASLGRAFSDVAKDFERSQPGVKVVLQFAGTQELRTQLEHGASADVFASADQKHMQELVRSGLVSDAATFARGEPVLVVSQEASDSIRSLEDLPRAKRIVLGAAEVPIGRYARQILDRAAPSLGSDFRARVEEKVVSHELNVKQVLTKVRLGEADAGIVYRSDTLGVTEVRIVTIPPDINVIAEYPIAVVRTSTHPRLARAWIDHLGSSAGRDLLSQAGFVPPSRP